MAVYYKFKCAKDYHSIPVDGLFISVFNLKEHIFGSKYFGKGKDFDLIVTDAQTNEEYHKDAMIRRNTSLLVRRVPGLPRKPIVIEPKEAKVEENKVEDAQRARSNLAAVDSFVGKYPGEAEWNEFVNDMYVSPKALPVQSSLLSQDAPILNKAKEDSKIKTHLLNKTDEDSKTKDYLLNITDEDSKIKALINTPALDWQQQSQEGGFGTGRGFGRGMGGKLMGGRGFGPFGQGGFERKTPPEGYICHRCKVPGHFIQHCPTNGDPNYDVKRLKPPTGIPKSMLMATQDGSYALPSGAVAVFKPNEAAFEKQMEGLPSTRPVIDIPPELRCPLCKEVMKDAVLTSKCCFQSFCDKCIRGNIISKSMCICGDTIILADDLVPNKTLRDTIKSILESNSSSAENSGSLRKSQESARSSLTKVSSTTLSATSERGKMLPTCKDNTTPDAKVMVNEEKPVGVPQRSSFEKIRSAKNADISEVTLESMSPKEQSSAPPMIEEVPQNLPACEPGTKKKKKKTRLAVNAGDLLWGTSQGIEAENYMLPVPPSAYNPYWGGMQLGMDGYMFPYNGYMGYAPGPFDNPIGGMLPQGSFGGGQGYLLPGLLPHRDISELCTGLNPVPHAMGREASEARKTDDLRRKREFEGRHQSREHFKDQEFGREVSSSADVSSMKSKHVQKRPTTSHVYTSQNVDHHHHHQHINNESSGARKRGRVVQDDIYESNDDDDDERNFKRKRSWYESKRSSRDVDDDDYKGSRQYERRRRDYGRRRTTTWSQDR